MSSAQKRRIWSICLLIVFALASIVLVIRVARQPSEPVVSINVVYREYLVNDAGLIIIEVSNKMSFNVNYSIVIEVKEARFTNMMFYSITGHAQKREFITGPLEGAKWHVSYG